MLTREAEIALIIGREAIGGDNAGMTRVGASEGQELSPRLHRIMLAIRAVDP